MSSSEGPVRPREEKDQKNNQTEVVKGFDICRVHKIQMESSLIDVPILDEDGNDVYDSDGNLITERIVFYFCRECDAD